MKILIINDNNEIKGGSEIVMYGEIDIFKKKGHKIYTFTFSDHHSKKNQNFVYKNSNFYPSRVFSRFVFNYKAYITLKKYIEKVNPDIIHIHHNTQYTYSILSAIPDNIPTLYTVHDYGLVCASMWGVSKKTGKICNCKMGYGIEAIKNKCISPFALPLFLIKKFLTASVNKKINIYIAPSLELKKRLDDNKFKNVIYIPNFFNKPQSLKDLKVNIHNYILYVGGLTSQKGIDYLIKSMSKVVRKYPMIKLILIGEGKEKYKFEILAKKLNLNNNILFLGKVSNENIYAYYKKALLLIYPSVWMENLPCTIIEAMGVGLPVIGSKVGGIPELVKNEVTGYLSKQKDEIDLASKIILALSNKSLLNKMGFNSKNLIKNSYSAERYYLKLLNVYKTLLNIKINLL